MNKLESVFRGGGGLLALAVVLYLALTLVGIDRYPAVWVDEAWIAEPAASLAAGEPFGNPSHGELHRYHDRVYWMPPLHLLGLAGVYATGADPWCAGRILSLAAGLGSLLLLVILAGRLLGEGRGDPSHGLASATPSLWPWLLWLALMFTLDPTLWKVHRTIRFEALTGFWMMLAVFLAWDPARRARGWLAGLAAGLAALTHPTGFLAVPIVAGLFFIRCDSRRRARTDLGRALLVGLLTALPLALYLLGDRTAGFANVLGQNAPHLGGAEGSWFGPWAREWTRYRSYFAWPYLALPLSMWLVAVVAGLRQRAPLALGWILAVLAAGLAAMPNKTELYLTLAAPFVYLLAAWVGPRLRPRLLVAVLAVAWLANLAAADAGLLWRNRDCGYSAWAATVDEAVPTGASVGGTFLTWWPLRDRDYHEFHRRRAGDLFDARVELVLWGDTHLQESIFDRLRSELGPFLAAHADTTGSVPSPCYGNVVVYRPRWEEAPPALTGSWERYGDERHEGEAP